MAKKKKKTKAKKPMETVDEPIGNSKDQVSTPGLFSKLVASLHQRAWALFSRDAAALRMLNYRGCKPEIEAWVISEGAACTFQRKTSSEVLLGEIRNQVKRGSDLPWETALSLSIPHRSSIETTRVNATLADLRDRRCIFTSVMNDPPGKFPKHFKHLTVYYAVGDKLETVWIQEPDGIKTQVPISSGKFWMVRLYPSCPTTSIIFLSGPFLI